MRVFVPITTSGLRSLLESGGLGPPPIRGYAVTAALREWYAEGDEEELEYVAMTLAAQASLGLLAVAEDEPARRMVVAVETDSATPAQEERAGMLIQEAVAGRQVASVHADTAEAASDVAAAVRVVRAGGPRDHDEQFLVDGCESHELAWFAAQEISDLL